MKYLNSIFRLDRFSDEYQGTLGFDLCCSLFPGNSMGKGQNGQKRMSEIGQLWLMFSSDWIFAMKAIFVHFLVLLTHLVEYDDVVSVNVGVVIPLGKIRGSQMSSASGRKFLSFRGIPYAKPPVGQLRFQVLIECSAVN